MGRKGHSRRHGPPASGRGGECAPPRQRPALRTPSSTRQIGALVGAALVAALCLSACGSTPPPPHIFIPTPSHLSLDFGSCITSAQLTCGTPAPTAGGATLSKYALLVTDDMFGAGTTAYGRIVACEHGTDFSACGSAITGFRDALTSMASDLTTAEVPPSARQANADLISALQAALPTCDDLTSAILRGDQGAADAAVIRLTTAIAQVSSAAQRAITAGNSDPLTNATPAPSTPSANPLVAAVRVGLAEFDASSNSLLDDCFTNTRPTCGSTEKRAHDLIASWKAALGPLMPTDAQTVLKAKLLAGLDVVDAEITRFSDAVAQNSSEESAISIGLIQDDNVVDNVASTLVANSE